MANCYLACVLYLFTLHAAALAGGYSKDVPAPLAPEGGATPEEAGVGPAAEVEAAVKEPVRVAPTQPPLGPHSNLYPSPLASPYPSPYPAPSSLNPGGAGPVVSTDYVSRYVGPGAAPVVLPDGTLADTPEVIAARAAHFDALQRAQALRYGPQDDGSYNPVKYGDQAYLSHGGPGPNGYPPVGPAGYPTPAPFGYPTPGPVGYPTPGPLGYPTPGPVGYPTPGPIGYPTPGPVGYPSHGPAGYPTPGPGYPGYNGQGTAPAASYPGSPVSAYQGPLAMPTVLPSGYLADNPDVAAARSSHLSALARAHEEADLWKSNAQSGWK